MARAPAVQAFAAWSLALLTLCAAAPHHYLIMHSTDAVRAQHAQMRAWTAGGAAAGGPAHRRLAQKQGPKQAVDCGLPPAEGAPRDPMWFTQAGCSISSMDNYAYIDAAGTFQNASKGELIQKTCDDVMCPIPAVPDCYENPGICAKGEWCWINQHEKWGAWAMGAGGATPSPEACSEEALAAIDKSNASEEQKAAMRSTRARECTANITYPAGMEVWKPVRGQCLPYRQEQQSCISDPITFDNPAFNSVYHRMPNGRAFVRPLVCDPAGGAGGSPLVCTGPEYEVMPSTCVQARPRDQCFSGPWWISTDCPRTAKGAPKAGLSREQALSVASTAMLLFEGEVAFAATCAFWDTSKPMGRAVEAARKQLYAILGALWPDEAVAGAPPSYEALMARWNVSALTDDMAGCYEDEAKPDSDVARQLAALGMAASQPNKVWSLVHFVMHNQPEPMTGARAQASRALAVWLLNHFWCDDCRGFFYEGIVSVYGLPPEEPNAEANAKWWWFAHNVASEHVANVRGGHPWIHQLGAPDVAQYQNPFFMRWEDARAQWTVEKAAA